MTGVQTCALPICLTLNSEKYFIKNLLYIILSSLAFPAALELFLGGNNAQSDYVVNVSRSFQILFLITYDLINKPY
mgnify:CR=1 FL=1